MIKKIKNKLDKLDDKIYKFTYFSVKKSKLFRIWNIFSFTLLIILRLVIIYYNIESLVTLNDKILYSSYLVKDFGYLLMDIVILRLFIIVEGVIRNEKRRKNS